MKPIGTASAAALGGLQRQIAGLEKAAADVVTRTTSASNAASVSVSNEARAGGESADAGIEGAMVDTRISKYLAIANMKVLKTIDEMEKTAADLVR